MDSPLPPTDSRSVLDREAVARIIDPAAWGVLDGTIPQLPMTAKDRDRFDAWKQSSLRKADAILALALSLYAKIVEERDEAREAMKWVGQVYPSAREGGAWVSMVWIEFNRMRRFVGLKELPRRAAKGERQSVNIRLREALAAAEAALSPPLVGGGRSAVADSGSALHGAPSDAEGH